MTTDVKKVIVAHLQHHRRLVVPQLGAFIVKDPGHEVLFSELFKRDDGVLRGLLKAEGLGDIEAAGAIDRLVFDLRHAVQNGAGYQFLGLGLFTAGPNGTLTFAYDPQIGLPASESGKDGFEPDGAASSGAAELEQPSDAHTAHAADAEPRTSEAPSQDEERTSYFSPDPCVKGLTYGRPVKTTDPYTFVGSKPARRVDKFMIVAIIAAVLALGVIAYVYVRDRQMKREEAAYMEEMSNIVSGVSETDVPAEE